MSGPTVLILGGLGAGHSRALITWIMSKDGPTPRPSHIRIADKHLILAAANVFTVYVDAATKEVLKQGAADGSIEYRQANLLVESSRTQTFTLPDKHGGPSKAYDYVFDYTGEIGFDSSPEVYVERTAKLAAALGREATERGGCKAYVKAIPGFYKTKSDKALAEGEEGHPYGARQRWFHEAVRALAAIESLHVAILRCGLPYGPGTITGVTPYLAIGDVYRSVGKKMDLLWGRDLRLSTVHSRDVASASWAVASWLSSLSPPTRATALAVTSSPLVSCRPAQLKSRVPIDASNLDNTEIDTLAPRAAALSIPLFNVVDEGDTTQGSLAEAVASVFGIKHGFQTDLISKLAAMDIKDTAEEVHEQHWDVWVEMLGKSNPPISNSPVSPDLPLEGVSGESVWLQGGLLTKVTGWTPTTKGLNRDVLKEVVDSFKADKVWPTA